MMRERSSGWEDKRKNMRIKDRKQKTINVMSAMQTIFGSCLVELNMLPIFPSSPPHHHALLAKT